MTRSPGNLPVARAAKPTTDKTARGPVAANRRSEPSRGRTTIGRPSSLPVLVGDVLSSAGQALDAGTLPHLGPRLRAQAAARPSTVPLRPARLEIGSTNDPEELRADRGADLADESGEPGANAHPSDPALRSERIRIHTDAAAALSARRLGATAYAVPGHIVFGASAYDPGSSAGRRLIRHELVHALTEPRAALAGSLVIRRTPDTTTADYRAGYEDGFGGNGNNAGVRTGQSLEDYNAGYGKGLSDANPQTNSSPAGPPGPAASAGPEAQEPAGPPAGGVPAAPDSLDAGAPAGVSAPSSDGQGGAPASAAPVSGQGGAPGHSSGLTTGQKVIGVVVVAAIVGGIALIIVTGGAATPAVILGIEGAEAMAAGTVIEAGTTVVAEVAAASTAEATVVAAGATADVAATGATAATADVAATGVTAASTATTGGLVLVEDSIASGAVNAGGKLVSVLRAMQQGFMAARPATAMAALSVIQQATRALGLDIGYADTSQLADEGRIVLSNVGGVVTTILANGSVTVERAGQVLLRLVN